MRDADAAVAAAAGRLAAAALHPGGVVLLPDDAAARRLQRGAGPGQETRARLQGPRATQKAKCRPQEVVQRRSVSSR